MNPCWLVLIVPATVVVTLVVDHYWRKIVADSQAVEHVKLTPKSRTMLCDMTRDLGRLNDTCRAEH